MVARHGLETERLLLRPVRQKDLEALHAFWIEPEVRRYLWDDKIISKAAVADIIASSEHAFEQFGYGFFTLAVKNEPELLMGFCGNRLFEDQVQVELLYGILPDYWGKGLGSEAARAVLRYDFEQCGLDNIIAATDTPNQRSVRVLQRLGMSFLERREWHGLDTVFYNLSKGDFEEIESGSWVI